MVNMRNFYPAFFILGAVFCCCFSFTCSAKLQKDESSIIPPNSNEPKHSEAVLSPQSSENLDNDVDDVDDINEADLETALKASDLSSLSVWSIVRGLWNWVKGDIAESLNGNAGLTTNADGRTFGKIRRLQMALIPIIFKFGVLSAMVAFLVVLGLKSLFLLKVLVLMNAAVILGKFLTFKTHFGGVEHAAPQQWTGYSNWSPHITQGWSGSAPASNVPQNKEIHLHIHGAQSQPQVSSYTSYNAADNNGGWQNRNDAYSAYEPTAAASDQNAQIEVKNAVPMSITPTQYPTNHLTY